MQSQIDSIGEIENFNTYFYTPFANHFSYFIISKLFNEFDFKNRIAKDFSCLNGAIYKLYHHLDLVVTDLAKLKSLSKYDEELLKKIKLVLLDWENNLKANMAFTTYSHVEFIIPAIKKILQDKISNSQALNFGNDIEEIFMNVPDLITKQVRISISYNFSESLNFLKQFISKVCPIGELYSTISNINISIPNYKNKQILDKKALLNYNSLNVFFDVDQIITPDAWQVNAILSELEINTNSDSKIISENIKYLFPNSDKSYISQGYSNYKNILAQLDILEKSYEMQTNYAFFKS